MYTKNNINSFFAIIIICVFGITGCWQSGITDFEPWENSSTDSSAPNSGKEEDSTQMETDEPEITPPDTTSGEPSDSQSRQECPSGYSADEDGDCWDIDECLDQPCFENQVCANEPGSYECQCKSGYYKVQDEDRCSPRIDFQGPIYDGDALLVINISTNTSSTQYTGQMLTDWNSQNPTILPGPQATVDRLIVPNANPIPTAFPPPGDEREFWLSSENESVTAQLIYIGIHCEIWAESPSAVSSFLAAEYAQEFDNVIYPMVVETFYTPSDINSDGRIAIMFFDASNANLGGYFNPNDMFDSSQSNKLDIIYVNQNMPDWTNSIIAHEFQHLVYFNRNILEEGGDPQTSLEGMWINEGLALASQHIYEGAQDMWLEYFGYSESIRNGHSLLQWDYYGDSASNYALSYIFFQYLRIQAGAGDTIFKEIIEDLNNNHLAVQAIVNKYIDDEMSFADFMIAYRLAPLLQEQGQQDIYGFKGEYPFTQLSPQFYNSYGTNLTGGGALYRDLESAFTEQPSSHGPDIRFVGVKRY